jgi:carboxymethylenebutenolidase
MAVPGLVERPETLRTQEVTFDSGGTAISAYIARPAEPGTYPGVLVVHEAFGPVEHIADLCRRFANLGFIALAPNLYERVGAPDPGEMASVLEKMFSLPDSQVVADLEAAARHLRADGESSGKVGCIGFCSGGRQTLLFACSSDQLDAAIDCWGGLITRATFDAETTSARPSRVIDLVDNLRCPLFVVGGAEDENPSPEVLAELQDRLERADGKEFEVRMFAGAGPAFLADYRPSYSEQAAFELWPQIVDFFNLHLR